MSGIVAKLDLSRAVRRFALTAVLQLEREQPTYFADGRWTPAASAAAPVTASVQPFAGDRQALPEGVRERKVWNVWSTSEIRPVKRPDGTVGDFAMFEGERYQFFDFKDWSHNGAYWFGMMAKVDQ